MNMGDKKQVAPINKNSLAMGGTGHEVSPFGIKNLRKLISLSIFSFALGRAAGDPS